MHMAKYVGFTLILLLATAGLSSAQTGYSRSGKNPHGPIAIPCENCHTSLSWKPIRSNPEFDHNRTKYPLLGMHEKVRCTLCHVNLVFKDVGSRCADCHADIHRAQFGTNCEKCHTVKGWDLPTQQVKEHTNRFPLMGAHAALECADCHKGEAVGQFAGLSTTCLSCHTADFQKAIEPSHVTLNFPSTCESCHGVDTWYNAKFDHLKFTGFALTGAHATLECTACHINGQFQGTPADCYGCHAKDYNTTTAPNHVQSGISEQCQTCHNTTAWIPATFDHNKTAFPLTGAHTSVPCSTCHTDNYAGTLPTSCYGCHAKDYSGTATMAGVPNHVTASFPQDCTLCHSTSTWLNATFDHSTTGFPLTGAHTSVACSTCHTDNYAGTLPTTCYGCHTADYNNTATLGGGVPNHVSLAYPQDCTMCHTTSTWLNATFNHNNTPFPLTGAHVSVPCAQCHIGGVFAGTPTDCYSCHKADYVGTTNPNHTAAGFPTTCATCHTTASWAGAVFNHTWFPTNHGGANGVCATCHTNPNDYSVFQCTNCHSAASTNPEHNGISGYVYNSVNCYACHKNGGGG
jgi:hypothetical protein